MNNKSTILTDESTNKDKIKKLIQQDKDLFKEDDLNTTITLYRNEIKSFEESNILKEKLIEEYFNKDNLLSNKGNKKILNKNNYASSEAFLASLDQRLLNKYENSIELKNHEIEIKNHGSFHPLFHQLNSPIRQEILKHTQLASYHKKGISNNIHVAKSIIPSVQIGVFLTLSIYILYKYTKEKKLINWRQQLFNILDVEVLR